MCFLLLQKERPEIAEIADRVHINEPTGVQSDSSSSASSSSSSSSSSESSESDSSDSDGDRCKEKEKHSPSHGDKRKRKRFVTFVCFDLYRHVSWFSIL